MQGGRAGDQAGQPTRAKGLVMIRSMTGYGRAHVEGENCILTVEMRSVNNRFLKISVRVPEVWERLSPKIEALVKEKVSRGSVFVNVRKVGMFAGAREFLINREAIEEYRRQLAEIKGGKELTLAQLLSLPGTVGTAEESDAELDEVWNRLEGIVRAAVEQMVEMRTSEGEHIRGVLLGAVERVRGLAREVRSGAGDVVMHYRDRLAMRVNELVRGTELTIDDADLARELAIFAERSDIREEIDRLESHLKQFASLLETDDAVGRRLEFLAQEMLRESNTMGSKVPSVELAKVVLDAKAEVDRLKEQVMNVE